MSPLRVLRVISSLHMGGVQRQMLLVLRELKARGVECEVAVLHKRGRLAKVFEAEGIPVHELRSWSRFGPLGLWRLRRLAMRRGIDVVHSHMYAANVATNLAFVGARRPVVVNGYHNQFPVERARHARRVRAQRGRPAAFVAVGHSVKEAVARLGPDPERIHVIWNGVVGPTDPPPLPPRAGGQPLRLMVVGRFASQKRLEFFPQLATACREAGVPVEISLFGDGRAREQIAADIERLGVQGSVLLPGVTRDVFGELARHHVYASASSSEGLPNALLEALSAGRPAILSDIAPHAEVIADTEAGILLPLEPEAWAGALGALVADSARLDRMAAAALALGQRFSIQNTASATLALYESLLR